MQMVSLEIQSAEIVSVLSMKHLTSKRINVNVSMDSFVIRSQDSVSVRNWKSHEEMFVSANHSLDSPEMKMGIVCVQKIQNWSMEFANVCLVTSARTTAMSASVRRMKFPSTKRKYLILYLITIIMKSSINRCICKSGFIRMEGKCECPQFEHQEDDQCLCDDTFIRNSDGICQCPLHMVVDDDSCVCKEGFVMGKLLDRDRQFLIQYLIPLQSTRKWYLCVSTASTCGVRRLLV